MIYINKTAKGAYVELDTALDAESNYIGTSWEEYKDGAWILLSEEQQLFREEHPSASVQEVFNMKINEIVVSESDKLRKSMQNKLEEIRRADEESNKFYISVRSGGEELANQALWIDKDLRNSLYSITLPALKAEGQTTTKLWTSSTPPVSVEVPVDWALEKLPFLEVYAKQTYDIKAENEAAVYKAYDEGDKDAIEAIDAYAGYPEVRTFVLDLDAE